MERHDDLIASIREAGAVPPPPARERAFQHAMASVPPIARFRARRMITLLAAAMLLALPAGAFQVAGRNDAPEPPAPVTTVTEPSRSNDNPTTTGRHDGDGTARPDDTGPGVDPQPSRGRDGERGHKGDPSKTPSADRPDAAQTRPTPGAKKK